MMRGLPHEYVRRVVETLGNFQDELIASNGFFAREEHFESCVDGVKAEFETDRRAISVFAVPEALSMLISILCNAERPPHPDARPERRRFENAFAATVLLSSGIGVRGIQRNPPLLKQLWRFIEKPGHHPVLIYYWARCASAFLSPHRPEGLRTSIAVLGLSRLLSPLIPLLDCEAVYNLFKSIVGFDEDGCRRRADHGVDLRLVLTDDISVVPCMLSKIVEGHEAAPKIADLLCSILEATINRQDAEELFNVISFNFLPHCSMMLGSAETIRPAECDSFTAFLRLWAQMLTAEKTCSEERARQQNHVPAGLLGSPLSPNLVTAARPILDDTVRLLAGLDTLIIHRHSEVAQSAWRLWFTFLQVSTAEIAGCTNSCALAKTAVELFTATDRNGGGRQDFLRHEIMKALTMALHADDANLSKAILNEARLIEKLEATLHMRQGAGGKASRCSPEHAKLMLLELLSMSEQLTIAPLLIHVPAWRRVLPLIGVQVDKVVYHPQCDDHAQEFNDSSTASSREETTIGSDNDGMSVEGTAKESGVTKDMENVDPHHTTPVGGAIDKSIHEDMNSPPTHGSPPKAACDARTCDLVVDNNSLRCAEDFSKLTPRPMFQRRSVLHRKAKEASPYYRKNPTPSALEEHAADHSVSVDALNETVRALHF